MRERVITTLLVIDVLSERAWKLRVRLTIAAMTLAMIAGLFLVASRPR